MKKLFLIIALRAWATVHAQEVTTARPHLWVDSFEAYKANIRVLDPAKTKACEKLLYDILEGIDGNASCTTQTDCTLLSQEPFGRTVPVRVGYSRTLLEHMKHFFRACDNGSSHSLNDGTTTDVAACWAGKCMVKTSIAK